jgi:D-methionine transport system ATP-binding protein
MIKQGYKLRLEEVNLTTRLGTHLLTDLSFAVQPGERAAIIGPSGAGKTSLLRVLNRLTSPTAGSIYLEGLNYREISVLEWRREVTLVLQESKLLGMSVGEAMAYPLKLRGLRPAEISERTSYWMEKLHVPQDWLSRTELQLSVGQRQLVAITRAMAIEPKILLLDEPTSALDSGKGAQLLKALQLLADKGTTILMANHQLEIAREFCTRVLHLESGKLVADVSSEEVDWVGLRQNLIAAEVRETEEWS